MWDTFRNFFQNPPYLLMNLHGIFIKDHVIGENLVGLSIASFLIFLALGFLGAPFLLWSLFGFIILIGFGAPWGAVLLWTVCSLLGGIQPLRMAVLSRGILSLFKKLEFLPKISQTELAAIEAGTVWTEGELFSGKPDFTRLINEPYPLLSEEEKRFLDGPVDQLCAMIDDWKIWEDRAPPPDVWNFICKEKFLGLIIPKEYGGLGFSAMGHSEVIRKIGTRSQVMSIYVMVPNSLGPAELLIHYGTEEQKKRMLPRLATGDDIPCFALTEPLAGSDAGSITSEGVLFKGKDGTLQLRLNWDKRWITLASMSTIVGLAFQLKDPDKLLGKGVNLGITCALIPANTPGITLGMRHDPLGIPFHNCPTQGKDVIVSADAIVGGIANAGRGWRMLMECLAAGRGVSLPAQSTGGAQLVTRVVSAHALVRQQFGVSIGRFEGIQDPLSKIVGFNYIIDSLRCYTLSALNQGKKPGIATAISKYYSTELARLVINHAMDIMGGAGISLGPKNLLGHLYISTPIGITVEGANILTRTLMIFGQGALRAHPFAFKEVKALNAGDLYSFDQAFWGHIRHVVRNSFRSVLLSITRGWLSIPPRRGSTAVYYRRLGWASASFAILADIAMGSLGGKLKFKESLGGRFADILAYMYIGTAVLRRFEAEGAKREDLPLVHFSMCFIFGQIQRAFDGIFANLQVPGLTWFFAGPLRSWSAINSLGGEVSDVHVKKIAEMILENEDQRNHLTQGMFIPKNPSEQLALLDRAVSALRKAEVIEKKLKMALKSKLIQKGSLPAMIEESLKKNVITQTEANELKEWDKIRKEAIQVDAFTEEEYLSRS